MSIGNLTGMAQKRSYEDGCAAAHALELIGERWALLIIRELMLGPRRFKDLREGLPGISPNVLTQRLDELARASIIVRRMLPPPASARVYDLSEWGRELEPIIKSIGRWAASSPTMPMGKPLSVNSLILSLRTMFDGSRVESSDACIGIIANGQEFVANISDGAMHLEPGGTRDCDAAIEGDPNDIASVIYAGRSLEEAVSSGALRIGGTKAVLKKFLQYFPLPERAPDLVA